MFLLVNAAPPKPLDVATLNFVPELVTLFETLFDNIVCP